MLKFSILPECDGGKTCRAVANCPYTIRLQEQINESKDYREKFELQTELYKFIESRVCGQGPEPPICCDEGKKYVYRAAHNDWPSHLELCSLPC